MNDSTFKAKLFHAAIMAEIANRPDYWRGYSRGFRRAYHGGAFGLEGEHDLWLALADRDDEQSAERGLGYLHGLEAD